MNENIQDANPPVESSAPETQETQNTAESAQVESSATEQAQPTPSQQQDANQSAAAGNALPPKDNLYGEFRRKLFEELPTFIQSSVREAMLGQQQVAVPQNQQPQELKYQGKYSAQELENILRHPDANEYDRAFATKGLAYLEVRQDILKEVETRDEKKTITSRQQQALQEIVKDYPQVFNSQTNQWNFADPLWQTAMKFYNSEPRLQSFGNEGLRVAMDRAYAQMAREGQLNIKKKEVKLNSQQRAIDKNQSQALNSGTLTPVKQSGQEMTKAKIMEAWKKNPDDPQLRTAALKHLVPSSWYSQ